MSTSSSYHDVAQIEVKAPKFSNGHSWTSIVITHRASGQIDGEYAEVVTKHEIALHHKPNFHGVLPLVLEGQS